MKTIKPPPMFNKKEEIRNQRIIAIVCFIALFLIIVSSHAQVDRIKNYNWKLNKESVTKYPHDPITLQSPKSHSDTIFLSIQADSVGSGIYGITLYAYFPKDISAEHSDLYLGFEDGTYERFGLISHDKELGYSEYEITQKTLSSLIRKKYNYIGLENVAQAYIMEDKDYFMKFLAAYDK